jgi:hypothetical protein
VEWLEKITVEKCDVNAQQPFRESFFAGKTGAFQLSIWESISATNLSPTGAKRAFPHLSPLWGEVLI